MATLNTSRGLKNLAGSLARSRLGSLKAACPYANVHRARLFSSTAQAKELKAGETSADSPFSFLPSNALVPKSGRGERSKGLTEIRGSYYNPVTYTYLDELLSDWGEFVDGVKFAGGAFSLMPPSRLKRLMDMIHSHDVYVSTGGFVERVIASSGGNTKIIGKYLETCKEMGFDVLELSCGFLSLPTDDWTALVKLTKSIGLKPKPEIGILFGAGGDTEGLESKGTRDPRWVIEVYHQYYEIIIESEGITENVKEWRTDVVSSLTSALPVDKLMFEAAEPAVFAYYIQTLGADVNVFVDHSQIVQLACLRKGIWGTSDLFGRVTTFKPKHDG
ncbi:phospho-3-sulfolactate synthase coma [Fomitiporia mediterranea MF3/22]|uniref:phospho-3-sulfolactate synthase coma n=1 Tax=Fomitiporia mediterranea (strain MF3/22) TaxID=694068 RepID=UPI0004407B87|nr:phospho-3-sulfolactate synthase coma [Fomitiporia mediterranea MF3/22]EJD00876.1 phospho-3-sulfolactate synthase coma [Fomitiporia mediterranea MF3/22]